MAYVYIYLDPRLDVPLPIYIGKGTSKKRMFAHKYNAENPILKNKINAIRESNLEPIIEIVKDNLSNDEAVLLEKELILKYGRIDLKTGSLCNLTEGGEGTVGLIVSEETKQLMSNQRKGKKQTPAQYEANCNRVCSEETKEKIRQANIGICRATKEQIEERSKKNIGSKRTEETKQLMSNQRKGKKQTPAQYEANCNRIKKKVKCLTNDTIYDSVKIAAEALSLKEAGIRSAANGNFPSYKSYKFEYIE